MSAKLHARKCKGARCVDFSGSCADIYTMKTLLSARVVRIVAVFGSLLLALAHARAVNVANYTFAGNSLASSDMDSSSAAADFVLGAGIASFAAPAAFFVNSPAMMLGSDHTPATEADAITGNDYFSFTVTPSGGGALAFGQLSYNFAIQNNSNTITTKIALRWSVDNFATTLDTGMITTNSGQTASAGAGVDLTSYGAQTGPVEFRFYIYDDQDTQFSKVGIDSITLDATFQAAPPRYRIIDLGTLGGNEAIASDINNAGQIVGGSETKKGDGHAFIVEAGRMRDLGVIAGSESRATSINGVGQVVGESSVNRTNADVHACLFSGGRRSDLGVLPGNSNSRANDINVGGLIVGVAETATGGHAVSFGTTVVDLDPTGDDISEALAVNNSGTVVGYTVTMSGQRRAVIFTGGAAQDLGVLGAGAGDGALCTAINDAGVIVGKSQVDGTPNHGHAFIYNGTMTDLGTLDGNPASNSAATGINNPGHVVGTSETGGQIHAFLHRDGKMFDLHTLATGSMAGFTSLTPRAINDDGWIVGSGALASGETHAFLAVPGPFKSASVIAKDDTAAGVSDGLFSTFGPPAIDAMNDVAFRATIKGSNDAAGINTANNSGIWIYNTVSGTLIARTGDPANTAPGTNGALFTKLSDPVLAGNGALAFIGKLKVGTGDATKANSIGVWRHVGGTTTLVCRADGGFGTAKFTDFHEIAIDERGYVSLLADMKDAPNVRGTALTFLGTDNSGTFSPIFYFTGGGKKPTVLKPAPNVAGQGRTVDPIQGRLVDLFPMPGAGQTLTVFSPTAAGFIGSTILKTGDTHPAGGDFDTFGPPAVNAGGTCAFRYTDQIGSAGLTAKNNTGIAVHDSSVFTGLAFTGSAANDRSGAASNMLYAKLGEPVLNNHDRVAFIGTLANGVGGATSSTNTGVWSNADGTLKLIAREGDEAPGYGGGKFAKFDQIVLPDVGGVAMLATVSGVSATRNQGVWAVASDGTLTCVVREGDVLLVNGTSKIVKKLGIFQVAPGVMGQSRSFDASTGALAYLATFTDGTSAICKATLP